MLAVPFSKGGGVPGYGRLSGRTWSRWGPALADRLAGWNAVEVIVGNESRGGLDGQKMKGRDPSV